MKKIIFILYIICVFGIANAQQKTYSITWASSKVFFSGDYSIKVPVFEPKENYVYDPLAGLRFVDEWDTNQLVKEKSIIVSNVVYENISKQELYGLDVSSISETLNYELRNTNARNKKKVTFSLYPIIKTANGFKKIVSFTIQYKKYPLGYSTVSKRKQISNSVLQNGNWYRFAVDKSGVFKLTKSFLDKVGVPTDGIDPKTIRIFGNGGNMLPYLNSANLAYDPLENAIQVIGEADGKFDDSDYILFYAQGPDAYTADNKTNRNVYNNKTYYYINVGQAPGKRMQTLVQPAQVADTTITTFQDYKFHELDEYNLAELGRRWFGDRFDTETTKTFDFSFPNIVETEPASIIVEVGAVSTSSSGFDVNINGNAKGIINIGPTTDDYLAQGSGAFYSEQFSDSKISVRLSYDKKGNPSARGYLDFISISATRKLAFEGSQFSFKNVNTFKKKGVVEYQLSNTSDVSQIWDITNIFNVASIENNKSSSLSFKSAMGSEKVYLAVTPSDYYEPLEDYSVVKNQNIKGSIFLDDNGKFKDIDYLILTTKAHLGQANRLAEINRKRNGLNVKVLTDEDIYVEFNTGNRDITAIRNCIKYIYDNASLESKRLKYLCFFGDSSVDYQGRRELQSSPYDFPSWYSLSSFNLTSSYISDDFYGCMDENEGKMGASDKLDIATGRIIANSTQQAKDVLDKIERYYDKLSYGSWRNNLVFVSDDLDDAWENVIQTTTDKIADTITARKPFFNTIKIHSDAYKQESSAGGDSYPEVTRAMNSALENGALVINYFGHGGEDGLASERIFQKTDVQELRNEYKLNCMVTVTCEYSRFDNPYRDTAGEFAFWNKNGASVALISTTRKIFVGIGTDINEELGKYLFSYVEGDEYEDYEYPSMAEAVRLTKNDKAVSGNSQKRFMFFFGDPAMKLAIPRPNVRLTKINDVPITKQLDTLKALSYVKLSGEVVDVTGKVLKDYNGELTSTIFDKTLERETLANDGTVVGGKVFKLKYKTLGSIIYRGKSSVKNGVFNFDFVVPKDISISTGQGKLSFYSVANNFSTDQAGADTKNVIIGGINEDAPEDNQGPIIKLYMNDKSFVSGGITNESPTLLVNLEDENGINTVGGIGHDIVAIIDGDEVNPFVLNDYYSTELDNYKKGELSYPFRNLKPGLHTLSLKAWDVYNNSSTAEIQFMVYDEDEILVIDNVLNYPNPFINYTEFWFNHNSSEILDISVQIFTISGKLVRTLNGQTSGLGGSQSKSLSRDIMWDGKDDFGQKIGKGTYIYKLTVHSKTTNKSAEKIEKLVIL